jgi:hypothetical protein
MIIEQTVEIPADHRLTIDVPREVPAGRTILICKPAAEVPAEQEKAGWRALMGIDKGKDTMEAYFQRHWAENDRERELDRRQYPERFHNEQL